jgi:phosphoserine phosphatase
VNACLNKRRTRKRNIKKKRACAAAARMMNDFDFERSRRQSLSPSQDWPSELVQSFLPFFLFFSLTLARGVRESRKIPVRLSDCAVGVVQDS